MSTLASRFITALALWLLDVIEVVVCKLPALHQPLYQLFEPAQNSWAFALRVIDRLEQIEWRQSPAGEHPMDYYPWDEDEEEVLQAQWQALSGDERDEIVEEIQSLCLQGTADERWAWPFARPIVMEG
jgi:hypothetical protein